MSDDDSATPRGAPPLTAPAATPGPKRLYRDPRGPLGGVCAGLAAYFDIDPVIVRLLFIVALFSGIGFFAYIICWVAIPKAKHWPPAGYEPSPAAQSSNRSALFSGLIIIALAALIGSGMDGVGDYVLPAALIGFGVYLLSQRPAAPAQSSERERTASLDVPRWAGADDAASNDPEAASARPSPPLPGSLTPTVLSVLALGAGILLALHSAGVLHVTLAGAAAGGLLIVGAGLVASAWLGSGLGLVPIGVALAGVMVVAASVEPWLSGLDDERDGVEAAADASGFHGVAGKEVFTPLSVSELRPRYVVGGGKLILDLSELDFTGTRRVVDVEVGLGKATIIVPDAADVEVRGEVGLGKATVFDTVYDGAAARIDERSEGLGSGELIVNLEIGLGKGTVRRASER